MSISNHTVDLTLPTDELELLLTDYEGAYDGEMGREFADDAYLEWLESAIELIEGELAQRESFAGVDTYNTPSLEDRGIELGSYAS